MIEFAIGVFKREVWDFVHLDSFYARRFPVFYYEVLTQST